MKKTIIILFAVLLPAFFLMGLNVVQENQRSGGAGEAFEKALYIEEVGGDLRKAIDLYREILKNFPTNRETAAKAQFHIGLCLEKKGLEEARKAFQTVLDSYPDQIEIVRLARGKLQNWPVEINPSGQDKGQFSQRRIMVEDQMIEKAFSPDGRHMAYWENKEGVLCLKDLINQEIRSVHLPSPPLDGTKRMIFDLSWSPDGRKLLFILNETKPNFQEQRELYLLNIEDPKPRVLFSDKNKHIETIYNWTADGNRILASITYRFYPAIGFIDIPSGSFRSIIQPDFPIIKGQLIKFKYARVSPDGNFITLQFEKNTLKTYSISTENFVEIVRTETGESTTLEDIRGSDYFLEWTPDSRNILFVSDRTGKLDLWSFPLIDGKSSGRPEMIRSVVGPIQPLGMTSSGAFYYRVINSYAGIFSAEIDPDNPCRIASPPQIMSRKFENASDCALSSDSHDLAYIAVSRPYGGDGLGELLHIPDVSYLSIYSFKNHTYREFPLGQQHAYSPRWGKDDHFIYLKGIKGTKFKDFSLQRLDVESGKIEILFHKNQPFLSDMSFKGNNIYLIFPEDKQPHLIRIDLETKQQEILNVPLHENIEMFSISPDEKWLAYCLYDKCYIHSMAGGNPKTIDKNLLPSSIHPRFLSWFPDSQSILLTAKKFTSSLDYPYMDGYYDLWLLPLDGKAPLKMETETPLKASWFNIPAVTDGKRICYTSPRYYGEIWIMENFLPDKDLKDKKFGSPDAY